MIKKGEFEFPSPYWDDVSDMAKELIKAILVVDPAKRMNAEQIMAHPWIQGESTPRNSLPTVSEKMKEYNAKRRFKRLGYLVVAANRFKNILNK